jgi:hypothetical protein
LAAVADDFAASGRRQLRQLGERFLGIAGGSILEFDADEENSFGGSACCLDQCFQLGSSAK